MKTLKHLATMSLVLAGLTTGIAKASSDSESKSNEVNWTGIVRCEAYSHAQNHDCNLEFEDAETKDTYSVVESPDVLKRHCSNERDLKVKVVGELTSKFLFWGGNLKVKSFDVIEELDPMPRTAYMSERPRPIREVGR